MSVADWLNPSPSATSDFSFEVTDLEETSEVPSSADLVALLNESYWGEDYLADLAAKYGFSEVREKFLKARVGTLLSVKRGDFGEAVTVDYLKNAEGYQIPVQKLRHKIGANQTLPGTDCVALKLSNDVLVEVLFVESKLRTSLDLSVAVAGARQLKQDADSENPMILTFMARRLRETNDPLTGLFESYLFERNTALDRYLLMLLHQADSWDERILENLEDEEIELEPLHVYVAKIANLKELSDRAFSEMGAEVIEDDN